MEEAQTRQSRHRRRHRALHPGRRAGAHGRRGVAAEPERQRSETYSRTSGSSASGLTNGGREVVNYQASLSASYELDFWGKNRDAAQAAEETAIANRFDRDVVALTTLASVANAYFQVLASQDRIRTAERNIASAQRILDAIKQRLECRHRDRSRRRAAGERAGQSARRGAAAAADAGAERQRAGDAGVAAAGKRARHRRLAQPDRVAARHAGPAVGIADAAAGYPPPGSAARLRHRQCRQRPRAVLSEHPADRAGRLSELGAGVAVPAACGVLQPGRQPDAADLRRRTESSAISNSPRPGRTNCCRPTARR